MIRVRPQLLGALAALLASAAPLAAHAQAGPDPAAGVREHIGLAQKAAGKEWVWFQRTLCSNPQLGGDIIGMFFGASRLNAPDADFEPVKLFDNVYYVGLQEIGAYAINTSQGIILVDALFAGEEEARLISNMKKVGLDPKRIKYVIATHAHADHMGGAKYLQEKYGAKVVMSEPDWEFAMRGDGAKTAPRKDVVVADGDKVTLGDTSVTIYFTPGHTPGSTSVMFPVKEGGQTHMAAMWGGPQWGFANADVPQRELYERSLVRFHDAMKTAKPDVILENHPFLSNMTATFAGMRGRKAGTANPLVVGADGADRYMQIWLECGRANMERYKEYVARYGPNARQWPTAFAP